MPGASVTCSQPAYGAVAGCRNHRAADLGPAGRHDARVGIEVVPLSALLEPARLLRPG